MLPPLPVVDDPTRNPFLAAALAGASAKVPVDRIDEVTVFPRRSAGSKETAIAVVSAFAEGDGADGRRTIWTVQYEAVSQRAGKTTRTDTVTEQGTVPLDRVTRIVDGVVRRLDQAAQAGPQPEPHPIGGDAARWAALLAELGLPDA